MIFVAGAGAMADAANAMRRIQRNLDRRIARSKRRARAHAVRYVGDYEPERVEFPCAQLCGTCGYYVDELPDEQGAAQACPACGEADWLDLAIEPLADRLRDIEAEGRMKPPGYVRGIVVGASLSLFALAFGAVVLAGYLDDGRFLANEYSHYAWLVGCAAVLFVPLAYYLLPRPLSVLMLRGRQRMPQRWHVPLSLPAPEQVPSTTLENRIAREAADTLTAPISRRECLAYQVCVLFDTPGDARPAEWVLQEQRTAEVDLGDGLKIPPEALYLESPVELVDAPNSHDGDRYSDLKLYLRQRGLFVTDGEYHFYEARLEPGDQVDVADYDGQVYVVRHTSAAAAGQLPSLPRPRLEQE